MPKVSFFAVSMALIFSILSFGCSKFNSLLAPSPSPLDSSNVSNVRSVWSPFLNVHVYGACESQKSALLTMKRSGTLQGVRIGLLGDLGITRGCTDWMTSQGIEVLGLFDNEFLRNPDITDIFDRIVSQNPSVRTWEIGNEVQGPPGIGAQMQVQEYVPIFLKLFYHAKQKYPGLVLMPQSDSLGTMLDIGLDRAVRDGLAVVTVHYYGNRSAVPLQLLQKEISRLPATVRVWVTETGANSWTHQINYVEDNYPRLRNIIKADRIYWYALSLCDDFALIRDKGLTCRPPDPPFSPLFIELTDPSMRNN